ncbi:hypothetical protein [Pseudomonas oryzihabitans]|uniref:hypothetical protein n=1 Tax=Pseudomonas oryzihabitans TaxID=47885 RepID=UPI0011A45D4D|nr:hypothetical protein [Pseudomonas oryzihabitans]
MRKLNFTAMSLEPDLVVNWLTAEFRFWKEISEQLQTTQYDRAGIDQYTSIIFKYLDDPKSPRTTNSPLLELIKSHAVDNYIPNHDSPLAEDLSRQKFNPLALEQILTNHKTSRILIDDFLKGEYEANYEELILKKTKEYNELHEFFISQGQIITNTLEDGTKSLDAYSVNLTEKIKEQLEATGKEQQEFLHGVGKKVEHAIESSVTVRFWETKKDLHQARANRCKWAAIALGMLAAATLSLLILAAFKDQDSTIWLGFKLPNHFYVAISIIIGSAFVWALRISVQLMMTNFSLESEALERATVIKTYVAISDQIDDPEITRDFYKFLLSVNKVTISPDSVSPEAYKLLESLITSKKGG